MSHPFFHRLAKKFPQLSLKLRQAEKKEDVATFTKQAFLSSFYLSAGFLIALFMFLAAFNKTPWLLIPIAPLLFGVIFWYFMKLPDLVILKKAKEIDKEIVFAGKFMIIELNSGVPLYQVIKNIAENYGGIGHYFEKIIRDIDLGTETEEAINTAILLNPSDNFRKVLWQLANSINTGADVGQSLNSVLDQVGRQQMIAVERYGKKLNPIAMFYLMLAVILPSLGMVMGIVLISFVNVQLNLIALIVVAVLLGFFQYMFYAIIKSSRPAVDM